MAISDDDIDAMEASAVAAPAKPLTDDDIDALEANAKPKAPKMGLGEATLRGAAQGASFGFADEMAAGVGAAKDVLTGNVPSGKPIDEPGVTGYLKSLGDKYGNAYASYIDKIRAEDAKAQAQHPWAFGGGLAGGGVLSAFTPIGELTAPAKGASLAGNAARLAAGGALMGAGTTEAPPTSPEFYKAAGMGAGTNVAIGGALKGAGALASAVTPTNVARKMSNVLLNTPEEITDTYVANPQAVRSAPTRFELTKRYQDLLDQLKGEVQGGSAESRNILSSEGKTIKGSDISQVFKNAADQIKDRAEGVMGDDPQKMAAYNWLRDQEGLFAPKVTAPSDVESPFLDEFGNKIKLSNPGGVDDQQLSTNRVKDILQSLDRQTDYDIGSGKFGRIDDTVKKGVRSQLDAMLKSQSPAYTEQMGKVAKDTDLLSQASDIGQNPARLANVLRRVNTDQYGGGQVPADVLQQFDQRMGSDILPQSKLAQAREAFDKSVTNGSRNVQLFSHALGNVPVVGPALGATVGATVDKYGRQMTMSAVDAAAKLNGTFQSQGFQAFLRDAEPILSASRRADPSALLTMQLLERSNPELARQLRGGGPGAQ